jgi:hypothetical protein
MQRAPFCLKTNHQVFASSLSHCPTDLMCDSLCRRYFPVTHMRFNEQIISKSLWRQEISDWTASSETTEDSTVGVCKWSHPIASETSLTSLGIQEKSFSWLHFPKEWWFRKPNPQCKLYGAPIFEGWVLELEVYEECVVWWVTFFCLRGPELPIFACSPHTGLNSANAAQILPRH